MGDKTGIEWTDASRPELTRIADELANLPCVFWACEGPDAPFKSMRTCSLCASVQDLRTVISGSRVAV